MPVLLAVLLDLKLSHSRFRTFAAMKNIIKLELAKLPMKKYGKEDQRLLAIWAADCAEHVLPFFKKANPNDDRPRKAIETCQTWVRTGVFKMSEIRGAALAAHASARENKENSPACFAARAAGQAVATAHVPQHAFGSVYYALKAVAAAYPANVEAKIAEERNWQLLHLAKELRQEFLDKITIQKRGEEILIRIKKGKDF